MAKPPVIRRITLQDFLVLYDHLRKENNNLPGFRLCRNPVNRYFILKYMANDDGVYSWQVITDDNDKVIYFNQRDAEQHLEILIKDELSRLALEAGNYDILKTEFISLDRYQKN